MTHEGAQLTPSELEQAEALNRLLDRPSDATTGGAKLDPHLRETAGMLTAASRSSSLSLGDERAAQELWATLVSASPPTPSGPRPAASLGLTASPSWPPARPAQSWQGRIALAMAAVLLLAMVASRYGDLPGGQSTSTVLAGSAPTATHPSVTGPCVGTPWQVGATASPAPARAISPTSAAVTGHAGEDCEGTEGTPAS